MMYIGAFNLLLYLFFISLKLDVDSFKLSARQGSVMRTSCDNELRKGHKQRRFYENISFSTALLLTFDADTTSNFVSSASNFAQSDQNMVTVATNTFFASLTTRLTGVIIGNLLAGVFVKYVTDSFRTWKKGNEESESNASNISHTLTKKDNHQVSSEGLPSEAYIKLAICIIIDLLGDASFVLPGVGELEDLAWAPISAYALRFMFGSNIIAGLDFVKELLPATDVIPVATMAWFLTFVAPPNPLSDALSINVSTRGEAKKHGIHDGESR